MRNFEIIKALDDKISDINSQKSLVSIRVDRLVRITYIGGAFRLVFVDLEVLATEQAITITRPCAKRFLRKLSKGLDIDLYSYLINTPLSEESPCYNFGEEELQRYCYSVAPRSVKKKVLGESEIGLYIGDIPNAKFVFLQISQLCYLFSCGSQEDLPMDLYSLRNVLKEFPDHYQAIIPRGFRELLVDRGGDSFLETLDKYSIKLVDTEAIIPGEEDRLAMHKCYTIHYDGMKKEDKMGFDVSLSSSDGFKQFIVYRNIINKMEFEVKYLQTLAVTLFEAAGVLVREYEAKKDQLIDLQRLYKFQVNLRNYKSLTAKFSDFKKSSTLKDLVSRYYSSTFLVGAAKYIYFLKAGE